MLVNKLYLFMLTAVLTFCSCFSAFGQNPEKSDGIAEVSNNGNNISWVIKVPYESATLTISAPDGKVFRREFSAGSVINFSVISNRGEYYADGSFTYEIVLTPVLTADVKKALTESRRDANGKQVETDFRRRGILPKPMIESGTFTVLNGNIVRGDKSEAESGGNQVAAANQNDKMPAAEIRDGKVKATAEDQVTPDDLIVQGSICAGFDCVNNENFGTDTIRLKENNTRIKFDDTSTTAGFASNDWQLTANDQPSGGANKFSIDDITGGKTPFTILAGAPTNSIFVDSSGRLGLKTATPMQDVHVANGNTPAFRLEQNGSGGFTPQTWDIAGNEANFFVRDLTSGSLLPFRIRPGAPTSSIDIAANGNVGMGTQSPEGPLEISRGTNNRLLLLDDEGKLSVKSFLETKSGGVIFPDGTIQTTAATGNSGGGTVPGDTGSLGYLGPNYSTHFFGGNGILDRNASSARISTTTNGIGVSGGGTAAVKFDVATNLNLADTSASFVVYKIRYRDSDGTGSKANVTVEVHASQIDTGAVMNDVVFNSDTAASTGSGFATVTVCKPVDSVYYSFAQYGTWISAQLTTYAPSFGSGATQADLIQIQVYKSSTCP